ncbi:hypothetical protein [Niveispirillum fermenti]|uniref:hypothetical protein n=1 Tax=Niveispirillum fermenti TaxID=1233113 RepID=UPI003A883110
MRRFSALLLAGFVLGLVLPAGAWAESTGPQRFDAKRLTIRDVVGEVKVTVDPAAKDMVVTIDAEGEEFDLLSARLQGDELLVARTRPPEKKRSGWRVDNNEVVITVTLPKATPIHVDDMVGKLSVGDLDGPLTADIRAAADIEAGRLSSMRVDVAGAAGIRAGDIAGSLELSIAGAGDVNVGTVRQGADIRVSGFGNVDVAGIHGSVKVQVSGVGDIDLNKGDVDMLDVAVSGLGSLSFQGEARDRRVSTSGLASVRVNGKRL